MIVFWFWELNKERCIPTWWWCFYFETHKQGQIYTNIKSEPLLDMTAPGNESILCSEQLLTLNKLAFYGLTLESLLICLHILWCCGESDLLCQIRLFKFLWVNDFSGWNFEAEAAVQYVDLVSSTWPSQNCVWIVQGFFQTMFFLRGNIRNQNLDTISLKLFECISWSAQ